MQRAFIAFLLLVALHLPAWAQTGPMQAILQDHRDAILKSSRTTIGPVIDAVAASGLPQAKAVLEAWQAKDMWLREADGLFFRAEKSGDVYALFDFDTDAQIGEAEKNDLKQIKPNSGIRALIATALVQFQLSDPVRANRLAALTSLERNPMAEALVPLRASINGETDPGLLTQKVRLERLLTMAYDPDPQARIAAIEEMSGESGLDVRATLNPILQTRLQVFQGEIPESVNVASGLKPGSDAFPRSAAYDLLVSEEGAPPLISRDELRNVLADHIVDGRVGGVALAKLDTLAARTTAYEALVSGGLVPAAVTEDDIDGSLSDYQFAEVYLEQSKPVTDAARGALDRITTRVGVGQAVDLTLDALSLASIYFLAAIGLAITFGVMRVINMAHGEFIMMGAYTGYVVQQWVPNHTASILVAIPLAFAVTFAAGVAMERLVIRWLYNRPLETLLGHFRHLHRAAATGQEHLRHAGAAPDRARLAGRRMGAERRRRDQLYPHRDLRAGADLPRRLPVHHEAHPAGAGNPRGHAKPAHGGQHGDQPGAGEHADLRAWVRHRRGRGVAIGLFAKVTSELGSDYIVQSFMTVVVGGVGNIWGTLAGADDDRFPAEGDRVVQPVEHAGRADLHDRLHHHLHPVPAARHRRAQGPGGGGLAMQRSFIAATRRS